MAGVERDNLGAKPTVPPTKTKPTTKSTQPPVGATPGVVKTQYTEPRPGNAVSPNEPPAPSLQKYGFNGGVNDFNQRVDHIFTTYSKAYGTPPSPGLTLNLATSPVANEDIPKMFTVPQNPLNAKNRGIAVEHGYDPFAPLAMGPRDLADGIRRAAFNGNYQQYVEQHYYLIQDVTKRDKNAAAQITGAILAAKRLDLERDLTQQVNENKITPIEMTDRLREAGFLPSVDLTPVHGPLGLVAKGIGQVADSLVHSPAGLYQLGKSVGLDVSDQIRYFGSPHPYHGGTSSESRAGVIARAAVKQTAQDFEHPGQNPGYLFLDVLGFATPIAGGVARVGEAGRLLRAGEGASAAAKALARRPLQRATLNYGGFTEEMPLSQNPLVAAAQKGVIKFRETRANKVIETEVPAGLDFLHFGIAGDILDNQFSFAKKLGREADARKRIDQVVRMTVKRELDAAAGHSFNQARILSKTPLKITGGLTRGEQKAIQVLSWDDPNPLEAERTFHERAIQEGIGDAKAHQRQLADLKLAEKVLANPSPQFKKALALTKRVAEEQQAMKIKDLGLLPETAEGRLAKTGQALRGEPLEGGKAVTDESFYLKTEPRGKVKRLPAESQGYFPVRKGPYGIPSPRDLAELKHSFSAHAIEHGDFRIDATGLASEAYARTVRAVAVREEHSRLWDAAADTPRTKWDVPIRDVQTIPDKLREVVSRIDEGSFLPADAKSLPSDMRDLIQEMYPDPTKLTNEDIPHVKWIDRRLLGEGSLPPHQPGLGAAIAQAIQSPFRFSALYLRPAYILNKLGNHAMLWFDQGVHTVPNFIKAMSGKHVVGEENMRTIYELVGAGKSRSYIASKSGTVSRAVAEFWNRVADRDERAAAFVHYADLKGYKWNEADITRLLHDEASRAELREVTRRANKSLVEFDNLLPVEKDYIRHWIFVYPWVSRSAVYSIRAILEHPTKVDVLSHLGRQEYENDPIFKAAPSWFKRVGYIPIGWNHDGTPRVVNPTSVNTFSTLGDFVAMARGATVGDKYASAEDFLGPLPKYFIHAASGRDEFGNQYPGSQWWDAAKEVLGGLPQLSAWDKAHPKAKKDGSSFNLADRSSLEASLNANLKKTVMSPGWLDGYGTLIAGGLSPREVNLPALASRYWADQDPATRHTRELDLLNRALDIQGNALGREVPKEVRSAVADQANIDFKYKQFLKTSGRAPTDKERALFTVDYLKKRGLISDAVTAKAHTQLENEADASQINRIKNTLLNKYANGMALREWDRDVRALASFTPAVFNEKVGRLFAQGLVDQNRYQVSQGKLYDYGRKYIAFMHEAEKLRKSGASALELKAFQDAHDKPVDGLPSFVRVSWANQTQDEQQKHIASAVTQNWGTLSGFDKALLGRPSDPKVTQGWVTLNRIIGEQRKSLAREGRTFPSGYDRTLAKYVEKYYDAPGLVKDFDFAKQPLYDRMKMLRPIQKSPNANLWSQVFSVAGAYSKYLNARDDTGQHQYSTTQVRQMWRDYISSAAFQAWLGEHPTFKTELGSYGKNTLETLIG